MSETAGKSRLAFPKAGGAVRDIGSSAVARAFHAAYGVVPSVEFVEESRQVLKFRIVEVDNPRTTFTQSDIERVKKAAQRLKRVLSEFPDSQGLLSSLRFAYSPEVSELDLFRWLARLEKSDTAEAFPPVRSYRRTIKALAGLVRNEGRSAAGNGCGLFAGFLGEIETEWPGLIFPTSTRETGRTDYIRRSLS